VSARRYEKALLGALAGVVATLVMTSAMRRLHAALPEDERYPLPPREITDSSGMATDERCGRSTTLLAHFGYGSLTGALFALMPAFRGGGIAYGLGVWALSYLGWIPAARILAPVYRHPLRRNLLMIAAHVVWGLSLSQSLKELQLAEENAFARSSKEFAGSEEKTERGR
jgi:uncharacterized membrane protein YagU involved in acid resistance